MKHILVIILLATVFASCNSKSKSKESNTANIEINGAGATFPTPYYNLLINKYTTEKSAKINYGSIGSGGGIRSIKDKVVDFGASDAFLTDAELKEMPAEIVHIPTCLGAVVIAYNLEGITKLNLTPELLEGIFMGTIKNWNDQKIKAINPEVKLPSLDITVVYRSDGSGTTFIFSDYMSNISEKWNSSIGRGKSLNWPVGIGAKGNPGVAGTIKQTNGAVGYIGSEYSFAQQISVASLKNKAGNYIDPTIASISAAAKATIPNDTRINLTNSDAADAYPISGFTWIILYKEQSYNNRSENQALATLKFLDWVIGSDAQSLAATVHYAPLPAPAVELSKQILRSITFNGNSILK